MSGVSLIDGHLDERKTEYIEREAALSVTCRCCPERFGEDKCAEYRLISELPAADVVEVVRCKDCKYYSSIMFCGKPTHYGYCCNTHDSVLGNRHRFENDFCSYGEANMGGKGEGE